MKVILTSPANIASASLSSVYRSVVCPQLRTTFGTICHQLRTVDDPPDRSIRSNTTKFLPGAADLL